MEPSGLAGGDPSFVTTELSDDGALVVRIGIDRGGVRQGVIVLTDVVHFRFDGTVDFFDEIAVRRLPRTGPWPAEASHLLGHHLNESEMVWIRLIGPGEIEALARHVTV